MSKIKKTTATKIVDQLEELVETSLGENQLTKNNTIPKKTTLFLSSFTSLLSHTLTKLSIGLSPVVTSINDSKNDAESDTEFSPSGQNSTQSKKRCRKKGTKNASTLQKEKIICDTLNKIDVIRENLDSIAENLEEYTNLSSDAVGTPITERPPHRSVRADFPHTAPHSGLLQGIIIWFKLILANI